MPLPDVHTALRITPLSSDDARVVRRWLLMFLRQHNATWAEARGLGWTADEIDAQLLATDMVSEHWHRLMRASKRSTDMVRIARLDDRPLGCVWAAERTDGYLVVPSGVLNWVFVDAWAREHGVASALVQHANDWMRQRELRSVMVSVLSDNEPAQKLYAKHGLSQVDLRMMGSLDEEVPHGST